MSQILATRSIPENKKLLELIEQHAANTQCEAQIMVADHKYGTQALLKMPLLRTWFWFVQEFRDYG